MSTTAAFAVVACLTAQATMAQPGDTRLERLLHDDRRTVLVASHRACWKKTSENSIDGIRRCAADGIDIVEIDVRTTRDDVLVLMHDETVDRTTDGHGAVADLTAAEIAKLRLRERGGGPGTRLTEGRVPTFAQALAAIRDRVLMNIDVKAAALPRVIDAVVAARATRAVILNVPIDVDPAIMRRAQQLGIAAQPVYLEREQRGPASAALARAAAHRPASIQLIFDTPAVVDTARAAAKETRLFVNTMAFDIERGTPMNLSGPYLDARAVTDPDAVWGALIAHGVTIIQTDEPWRLRAWLRARRLR
ncbi:glycerophosphodiester phosphodiesterase family protein [Sphingomonas endophytica]|nr:glycerophosphodiester phosphodiesterase family protein [Sphingomonas endophytica]